MEGPNQMPKWIKALSFGLKVFRAVESAGLVPDIKGIPVTVIDSAVTNAAQTIIDAHKQGSGQ